MGQEGPIFFWKEEDPEWGWLCQWYPSKFHGEDEKVIFSHAEQLVALYSHPNQPEWYMMYYKPLQFSDQETANETLLVSSPRKCKALGRRIKGYKDAVWDQHKVRVVEEGSYHKFMHSVECEKDTLVDKLLATGERELVEASPLDRVWGVGFTAEQLKMGKKAGFGREKLGESLLGKALMAARERIRREQTMSDVGKVSGKTVQDVSRDSVKDTDSTEKYL